MQSKASPRAIFLNECEERKPIRRRNPALFAQITAQPLHSPRPGSRSTPPIQLNLCERVNQEINHAPSLLSTACKCVRTTAPAPPTPVPSEGGCVHTYRFEPSPSDPSSLLQKPALNLLQLLLPPPNLVDLAWPLGLSTYCSAATLLLAAAFSMDRQYRRL